MCRTMKYSIFLTLIVATNLIDMAPRDFKGYKVFRLTAETDEHIKALLQLEDTYPEIQFWTSAGDIFPVDVMIPPHLQYEFEKYVSLRNINYTVWIEDVQQRIGVRKIKNSTKPEDFNWEDYSTLDEINKWLQYLVQRFKPFVTLVEVGRTYENRTILGVHVDFRKNNKIVFIEAGIHGNEWIGPATATFFINEILTNTDPSVRVVVESRNWIIIPSLNPDGYIYTHEADRTWRKNRKPTGMCAGIDLNRNFPYKWMEGGAALDTCSLHYAGEKALSEPESQSLVNYFKMIGSNVEIYLAFHSYLQLFLIPYSHEGYEVPPNNDALHRISTRAARALYGVHKTRFMIGNNADILYLGSGTSVDWVQSTYNNSIKYVAIMELRDDGQYGFLLPSEQIIPTGEETLTAVLSIVKQIS